MKRTAPAAARNRDPILAVLREIVPTLPSSHGRDASGARTRRVLEIASGSGEHAIHFAAALPELTWQPTDLDASARASVDAWREEAKLANVLPAIALDASGAWNADADMIVCINMIHIAPWSACEGLVRGAARVLPPRGVLFLYGPFRFSGAFTAPSNAEFDASLRARDERWGVRDIDDVTALAEAHGFTRERIVPMPVNNHCIVYRR